MEVNRTDTVEFEIMIHDAGPDKRARLKSMLNFLQDTVDVHARGQGTSINDAETLNRSWVYGRFYARVMRYPALHEKVFCRTWRSRLEKYQAYREFEIRDCGGDIVLAATATLFLIDRDTRKPVELKMPSNTLISTIPEQATGHAFDRIPEPEEYPMAWRTTVRMEDIDINAHMNNVSYAQYFYESIYGSSAERELASIDISFRGEVTYKNSLVCMSAPAGNGAYCHKMFNETKGNVSALAVTTWRQGML